MNAIARLIAEDEKHRIKNGDFDVEFDQRRKTCNGFPAVDGPWIEIDVSDFLVGYIMANRRLRKSGAQHRALDNRLECGVRGALTVFSPQNRHVAYRDLAL